MHLDLNSSIACTLWSPANAPEPFSRKNESVHHTLGKEHSGSKIIDNYQFSVCSTHGLDPSMLATEALSSEPMNK